MADVENVSQVTAAATAAPVAVASSTAPDAAGSIGTNGKNTEGGEKGNDGLQSDDNATSNDLGTSPTQEKSSNSHPHDSEYDTASDLEGGEEYDDDEDDMDESLSDDDDEDDESETDDDDEDDDEGVEDDMTPQEKVDAEAQKKVDEDRSNPQYIPKRGTFYEHDDRTAEADGECIVVEGQEEVEGQVVANGATGSVAGSKSATTPTISSASKTMKKWQPASGVDRWSHDRFDASEQAPKSRTELVSAYGYDIRTEDAPPKARRRRRYGRGPSKYNRNWEDESAYLKTNNKERKPPKPSDFPALNENASKPRRTSGGRTREEKENRMERRQREGKSERSDRQGPSRSNYQDDYNDRRERSEGGHKNMKPKSNFNRQGQATVGRQAAMEFKQKNRPSNQSSSGPINQGPSSNLSNRLEAHRQPNSNMQNQNQYQAQQINKSPPSGGQGKQQNQISTQQHQNDNYNNNKKKHFDQGYQSTQSSPQAASAPQQNQQQPSSVNHSVARQNSQVQPKAQIPTSNLSQRLQQVQNRNDPSHVGSVQMHALATQNQQQQQLMQHQQSNNLMMTGPQAPQAINQAPQEQRGPPKRYSSLRRSQHEAQHIAEHQQLQQLHMQQQQQTSAPPGILMPAEQAMLQANLMQMYHQENIQAQMQALQVSQQPNVPKQAGYTAAGPQTQQPGPYPGTASTPAAYYVAPDAYTAASAAQATQASYAAQQAAPNYMGQQQTAPNLAYANPAPTPQQTAATSAFGAAANVGVVPQPNPAASTAPNYQNYNTVGGTTYFVPPPTQTNNRPVSLPQRRPTNAIPILPPSEKSKHQSGQLKLHETKDDSKSSSANQTVSAPIGSAENIDHIIDNMFVQRPAFQPPATATTASTTKSVTNEQSTISSTENSNTASSQDSNNTQSTEKLTNDSASTEISNNNPISTQE